MVSDDPITTIQVKTSTRDVLRDIPGTYDEILAATFKSTTDKSASVSTSTKSEGVVFISSTGGVYTAPTIDADKIFQFLDNPYLRSTLISYMNIIFPAPAEVSVYDPQDVVDEKLTKEFKAVLSSAGVRINEIIKKAYWNRITFGCSIINPVWTRDGNKIRPDKFRVLPSSSFDTQPDGYDKVYSSIMQGVVINDKDEVEVWQRQDAYTLETTQIKNFFMIKDPMDSGLAGDSRLVPLIAILDMLKYCWNTEMQAVNRAGSPIIFIKITNPQKANNQNGGVSDADYANVILKNWSNNKQYQLRENMEIVTIDGKNTKNILDTVAVLEQVINDYFSPTKLISKDGSHPLGSSGPELELLNQAIQSEHRWLEDQFEQLLNLYFAYNAYPEGYRVEITIPTIEPDQSELFIKQVEVAGKYKAIDLDDIREKLAFEPADDEKRAKIAEFWKAQQPATPTFPAQADEEETEEAEQNKVPMANKKHTYVKAIEKTEQAVEKELNSTLDDMAAKIMQAIEKVD